MLNPMGQHLEDEAVLLVIIFNLENENSNNQGEKLTSE